MRCLLLFVLLLASCATHERTPEEEAQYRRDLENASKALQGFGPSVRPAAPRQTNCTTTPNGMGGQYINCQDQ